jgi:Secretory lipase
MLLPTASPQSRTTLRRALGRWRGVGLAAGTAEADPLVQPPVPPVAPWLGSGQRPLLSYQPAEDGVGLKCAPSYGLRAGLGLRADLLDPTNNSSLETTLIAQAVGRGWAVVVPDYEGPNTEFGGGAGYAHGVLDGIRAATHFAPAGISASAPIGIMGYSGGSIATAAAIQAQPDYAPELRLAGAALGGTVGDLRATLLQFNAGPAGGAILIMFAGMDRPTPTCTYCDTSTGSAVTRWQESSPTAWVRPPRSTRRPASPPTGSTPTSPTIPTSPEPSPNTAH